ncbi:acyl transferase 4 [Amborella trichopoda]|uniref:acyl transferase 4 n=1 Tax=Amborella trichopoda TaxID=13333 RepID=UPI0009BD65E0|nr:acyl transferase 4 [Amborella trichopoda]|eukprot:XP_020520518.1 acyl transferase 4 [Amborella trichopoda]
MGFSLTKSEVTYVRPSQPTPLSLLELSVLDTSPALRNMVKTIHVYEKGGEMAAKIIKEALSEALVYYYPLAGRLKDSSDGKLLVDCSGEGIGFIEAEAECRLEDLNFFDGDQAIPKEQLLYGSKNRVGEEDPLLVIQVTKFTCGGFVMGLDFCHTICDGFSSARFTSTVAELARGVPHPSILPVWARESLRPKQRPSSNNLGPQAVPPPPPDPPPQDSGLREVCVDIPIETIERLKQKYIQSTGVPCTTFEAIAAQVWRYRARAIGMKENEVAELVFLANIRPFIKPPLPEGFYGNCFFPVDMSVNGATLARAGLDDAVNWIKGGKARLPDDVARWMEGHVDALIPKDLTYQTLFVVEWSRLGFENIDFGWGPPVHVAPVPYSHVIPACIFAFPRVPNKGVRLMTWCVRGDHHEAFAKLMRSLAND